MKRELVQGIAVVVTVGIIAGSLMWAVGTRNQIGGGIADTDTIGYDVCGFGGLDAQGWGQWNDPAGDARLRKEVFTTGRLWYGWWEDATSRPVTVGARLIQCGSLGLSAPNFVLYRFLYRESAGGAWGGFSQDIIPQGVNVQFVTFQGVGIGLYSIVLPPFELILDGFQYRPCVFPEVSASTGAFAGAGCSPTGEVKDIADGAALKVEVWVKRIGFLSGDYTPQLVAEDQVELRSALASEFEWAKPGYSTGETAILRYEVPQTEYESCTAAGDCTYRPAYFVSIIDTNTNEPISSAWDRRPLTVARGEFEIPVTEAYFSNDLATCQNRLRAVLYTEIIQVNRDDTAVRTTSTTFGYAGVPPVVTEVTFDKPEYQEGDTFTVSWTATGNVTKFHVSWHIAGLGDEQDLGPGVLNYSSRAPLSGVLEVEVTPYDRCQAGDVKEVQATVGNVFPELCELFPDALDCREESDLVGVLLAALAILLLLIVFVLVLWGLSKQDVVPPVVSLLIAVGIAGALAVLFALWGWFDSLLKASGGG